ncbi:MAG TPA: asparagine synthase (glutamine-hydrolyzing) [Elusimicrobia bacterium]|nr:MAG: asparagine synthase (glutamine-hydrolyzing) [Elusimicrobia bacterium RIFOXYA12_FULL_49_49]OGS09839.1 MAG: asparagine synthase (glutamine-hydrolyzing) [Elusimicrobia bacterium RIFOXYA1_FULL_47_7]OGS11071.1 MAG: asparagine synthase (glutamine-hydrolyzing) [Elusimicrobia bacterium RIFOXYB1_FULL_48_9]OGS15937.1 MAG: asparagine synthase (glutamine-hydrolyzing) [Elusimicrobia bacterium RIFOXYA2_FULL_47_53]OGS26381.1 MAG: asparagine synthase (glutamine-hydrolyzing) [Elusimicrobia bacterium RIF
MCGITGIYNFTNRPVDREILCAMADSLRHRGPDDDGYLVKDNIGLGFRRLSIIDLSTGHQPIHNEDSTVWVILNGEIYNFANLRENLLSRGHKFYTKTDTEVIVHLYEDLGESFLEEIDGMFALALWDSRANKLILARDRMGKKPLHYCLLKDKLLFGSEIKALLKHPECPRELDYDSVAKYFHFEYVPAPNSIFRQIKKLLPSEYLVVQNSEIKHKTYWQIPYNETKLKLSLEDASGELFRLLQNAVRKRLVSDVPLGVFLSGGIDSSTIAALMSASASDEVKSFSISFSDPDYDEGPQALLAARHIGTRHFQEKFSPQTLIDLIPELADFIDEPMADPSIVPTYLLSKFTKQNVTVALGGDGGDELFGGYPTYRAHKLYSCYSALPGFIRKGAAGIVNSLPSGEGYFSLDFKAKRFLRGDGYPADERHARWMSAFLPEELPVLFTPQVAAKTDFSALYSELKHYYGPGTKDPLDAVMYLDQKMYMQDDILVKVDRASMAASLEVRAPLLDKDIVSFAARLPSSFKLKGATTKYLLKRAAGKLLPPGIINRKKQGFALPLTKWIKHDLSGLLDEYLNAGRISGEGIFNPDCVKQLLSEHRAGRKDNRKAVWSLLVFQMWKERFNPSL